MNPQQKAPDATRNYKPSRIANKIVMGLENEKWLGAFVIVISAYALATVVVV
jgi:hypothetical protein